MLFTMSEKKITLSANLKEIRETRGLSQKALNSSSGVSFRTIQNIEAGISDIGASTLRSLANSLGVSIDVLIGGDPALIPEISPKKAWEIVGKFIDESEKKPAPAKSPALTLIPDNIAHNPDVIELLTLISKHPDALGEVLSQLRTRITGRMNKAKRRPISDGR